jgi:hypothetical protein
MISRQKVQSMYQSGAKHYDFTTILFRLIGLRMKAYRLLAIKKLSLQRGNCVIELGCGTGLNFPFLMEQGIIFYLELLDENGLNTLARTGSECDNPNSFFPVIKSPSFALERYLILASIHGRKIRNIKCRHSLCLLCLLQQ